MSDLLKNIPGVPDGYREDLKPILTADEAAQIQKLRDDGMLPPLGRRDQDISTTPTLAPMQSSDNTLIEK